MLDVTPFMVVMNEEYWIGFTLRELTKVFPRVIVVDTGSTDDTPGIAKSFPQVAFLEFKPSRPGHISPAFNLALSKIQSEWAFCVAGDEYYEEEQLLKLKELEPPEGKKQGFTCTLSLDFADGRFYIRGQMSANRIFYTRESRWEGIHPFETVYPWAHDKSTWFYTPILGWHMRDLARSSKDGDAFYRLEKLDFWKKSRWDPLDRNPFEPVGPWKNPYLEALKSVGTA